MRVLVVDDVAASRTIRRALLESNGHTVIEATNGVEALRIAKQARPDLVVSDILMPVMDGFSLCRIWKSDSDVRGIPFIFYTATYTEPKDREFGLKLGADGFLTKPLEGPAFLQAIKELVDAHTKADTKTSAAQTLIDEETYYKEYNRRLVEKLEDKLRELEQANREIGVRERELREAQEVLERRVEERTAALKRANQELEAFAYSVSHDLRAPLRAIDGFSQALVEDYQHKLDATGQDYLHRIRDASQRMGELIDNLLKLSRVSRRQLCRQPVNLSQLAADISKGLRESRPDRKVTFDIQPGLIANGDPPLLRIVLENLLGNAWKYTGTEDSAYIKFGAKVEDGEQIYYVCDNGVGFDMRYAGKLFMAFQRLHSARQFKGTGIGLATVARIVSGHGGGVWAEGRPNEGATFYFSLPQPRSRAFSSANSPG